MPTATELNINTTVDATDLANEIFGDGISITSATIFGDAVQYGIYTGGETTSPGVVPSDGGVILSTGNVADFTNSDGSTNTNTNDGTTTDTTGGVDGDAQLDAIAGVSTFDGVIFEADFVPTGDFITMQFVFSSEEYLEYVNGGVNDAVGVWVNGAFVPLTPTGDTVSIDTVNTSSNSNLYVDNPDTTDPFNTEMDGFTITMSMKAPVNSGQTNTIKIGLADGGDAAYDSNLLIAGDSIQTVALAFDDQVTLLPNDSRVVDVLANDVDQTGGGLTITEINGQAVSAGDTIVLATGESVTLNADGTLTVQSDGDVTASTLTYTVLDSVGNTDTGYLTINTQGTAPPDGTVEGSAGDDVIDASYVADPNGDSVDAGDAILPGDIANDDLIQGFGGDDSIASGDGDDEVYGGSGNDTLDGGTDNDTVYGGAGDDTLTGGSGNDSLFGGQGSDQFIIADDHEGDDIVGGEDVGDTDTDTVSFSNSASTQGVTVTANGAESGTYDFDGTGGTGTFTEIEALGGTAYNDTLDFTLETSGMDLFGNAGDDSITGGSGDDTIFGGDGADSIEGGAGDDYIDAEDAVMANDTVFGGTGNDEIITDAGNDTIFAGADNDIVYAGTGNDYIEDGAGDDILYGGAGNDFFEGGTGNDTYLGEDGDDFFSVNNGFGDDSVVGGETGEALGDVLSAVAVTTDTTLDLSASDASDPESGTLTSGSDTITFSEIENVVLGTGNDSVIGSSGSDNVATGAGEDTVNLGAGNDALDLGDGGGPDGVADTIILQDGFGDDSVLNFDAPTPNGDGTFTGIDTFDVSALTDGTDPVNVNDVTVGDDGSGNAVLSFPNGESVTLVGIDPVTADDPFWLNAAGIPLSDGTVSGTAGNDTINEAYLGDPDGDIVDGDDAILPGDTGNDDVIDAGAGDDLVFGGQGDDLVYGGDGNDYLSGQDGNDTVYGDEGDDSIRGNLGEDLLYGGDGNDEIAGGTGNDTVFGGTGDDYITGGVSVSGGDGNDTVELSGAASTITGDAGDDTFILVNNPGTTTVTGGESAEVDGDTLDMSGTTSDLIVDLTGADAESGTVTDGANVLTYSEIETIVLGGGTDTLVLADGSGDDSVQGFEAPIDNGDGTYTGIDQVDVSGLTSDGGTTPVTTADVVVTDTNGDGTGDAILTFPGGESLTLAGVAPEQVDTPEELAAIGIPLAQETIHDTILLDAMPGGTETLVSGTDMLAIEEPLTFTVGTNGEIAAGDTVEIGGTTWTVTGVNIYEADITNLSGGTPGTENVAGNILELSDGAGGTLALMTVDDGYGDKPDITTAEIVSVAPASSVTVSGTDADDNVTLAPLDYIVEGTAGGDLIDAAYTGDPEGDMVDAGDAADGSDNDVIEAGAGNDTVLAGAGDDTVFSGADDDIVYGGDGNDSIYTEEGDDVAYGGSGDDYFETWTGDDTVFAGTGNDTVDGADGNDTLYGEAGNDFLMGGNNGGEDALYGGDGDDTLWSGDGNDIVEGGAGDDNIDTGSGDDTIQLTGGFGNDDITAGETGETTGDTLDAQGVTEDVTLDLTALFSGDPESGTISDGTGTTSFVEVENFDLGAGNDSVIGSSGDDSVNAGLGADTIDGGAGNDTFDLGGFALFGSDAAQDTVVLQDGSGEDTLLNFEAPIDNGDGTYSPGDLLDVTALTDADGNPVHTPDVIVGDDGSGNAVLTFPNGESVTLIGVTPAQVDDPFALNAMGIPLPDGTIDGTAGNDVIDTGYTGDPDGDMVDANDAILPGDTGNDDVIDAGAGDDTILAGDGDDYVEAGEGDDSVDGGAGNDSIFGFEGSDTVEGGDGDDYINTRTSPGTGLPDEGYPGGAFPDDPDPTNDMDSVSGGAGNDEILTGDDNDIVYGGTGEDSIDAGFDDDLVFGGAGNDFISGNEGADTLSGDDGDDTIYGDDFTGTYSALDIPDNIDLQPDNQIDVIYGGAGNDTIFGMDDADSLYGGTGNDVIDGGIDNDVLFGGEGADSLSGGDGDDTVTFSDGDTAFGGAGDDLFILEDLGEPTNGTITIDGGTEDGADTLQLGSLGVLTQAVQDSFVDDGSGSFSGTITLDDGTLLNFSEIENIICFTPGTRIATPRGQRPIEDLEVGDLVVTRDHGLQPIRWIQSRTVPAIDRFAPVRIRPGVVTGLETDLLVSPQHRMLFQGYQAELLFGDSEVLVAATHLVDGLDVTTEVGGEVTYIHMMFDQHEIVYAEGAASESFHPGEIGLTAVSDPAREELFALFPQLRGDPRQYGQTARKCLRKHEARLIRF